MLCVRENAGHKSSHGSKVSKTQANVYTLYILKLVTVTKLNEFRTDLRPVTKSTKHILYAQMRLCSFFFSSLSPTNWKCNQIPFPLLATFTRSSTHRILDEQVRLHLNGFQLPMEADLKCAQCARVRAINFYYFMSLDVQWILDDFNWAAAWYVDYYSVWNKIKSKQTFTSAKLRLEWIEVKTNSTDADAYAISGLQTK